MAFVTDKEFNENISVRKEEYKLTKQWKELPVGVIYRIENRKQICVPNKLSIIMTLVDEKGDIVNVWAPDRLCVELDQDQDQSKVKYIRSNGLKQCKQDSTRYYFDFNLMAV